MVHSGPNTQGSRAFVRDDRLYLIHIEECIARIHQYLEGGHDSFVASTLIQDAVLRNLQVLAQSSQSLSDSTKELHPEVDWRGITAFRNVLVHDYLGINLARIWEIVEGELPQLAGHIHSILQSFEETQ